MQMQNAKFILKIFGVVLTCGGLVGGWDMGLRGGGSVLRRSLIFPPTRLMDCVLGPWLGRALYIKLDLVFTTYISQLYPIGLF